MSETLEPQIVNRQDFHVAGLLVRGNNEEGELTALWQRFGEHTEAFEKMAASEAAYGVIDNFDEEAGVFDYLAAVEVSGEEDVPEGMEVWRLLAQNYAVFPTTLATLKETIDQIYGSWLPHSNYHRAPGPEFEYYDGTFDPDDPSSQLYLYIPVVPRAGGE